MAENWTLSFPLEVLVPVDTGVEGEGARLCGCMRRAHGDAHGLQGVGVGIFHQQHIPARLGHGQGQLHFHLEDTGMTEGVCAACPCYKLSLLCSSGDNATNLIKSWQTFTCETLGLEP